MGTDVLSRLQAAKVSENSKRMIPRAPSTSVSSFLSIIAPALRKQPAAQNCKRNTKFILKSAFFPQDECRPAKWGSHKASVPSISSLCWHLSPEFTRTWKALQEPAIDGSSELVGFLCVYQKTVCGGHPHRRSLTALLSQPSPAQLPQWGPQPSGDLPSPHRLEPWVFSFQQPWIIYPNDEASFNLSHTFVFPTKD